MPRTLLCLFAHPDDEATVGPLLACRAAEGWRVAVVSATAGQMGSTLSTGLANGDPLGAARIQELRHACHALGILPPVVLQFLDGAISDRAVTSALVGEFRRLLNEWRPDEIITFGPEGASGHTDHRVVCATATEAFQEPAAPAGRLFYLAYPHAALNGIQPSNDAEAKLKTALLSRLVDDRFLDAPLDCRAGLDAAENAIRCHQSQWTPDLMNAWNRLNREWLNGRVYLRLALQREQAARPCHQQPA